MGGRVSHTHKLTRLASEDKEGRKEERKEGRVMEWKRRIDHKLRLTDYARARALARSLGRDRDKGGRAGEARKDRAGPYMT